MLLRLLMPMRFGALRVLPAGLVALAASFFATAGHAADCAGCAGLSGSQTTTSGTYSVSISVDVQNGECVGAAPNCTAQACEVTITRSWDLPAGIDMQFCQIRPPPLPPLCVYPPPNSGSGTGMDQDADLIRCGGAKTFSLGTSTLSAQATGSCSSCQ